MPPWGTHRHADRWRAQRAWGRRGPGTSPDGEAGLSNPRLKARPTAGLVLALLPENLRELVPQSSAHLVARDSQTLRSLPSATWCHRRQPVRHRLSDRVGRRQTLGRDAGAGTREEGLSRRRERVAAQCPPTWEATGTAHGGQHRGLHLDVANAGRMGRPQVLLLVLLRVGAQGPVQTALPCRHEERAMLTGCSPPGHRDASTAPPPPLPTSAHLPWSPNHHSQQAWYLTWTPG